MTIDLLFQEIRGPITKDILAKARGLKKIAVSGVEFELNGPYLNVDCCIDYIKRCIGDPGRTIMRYYEISDVWAFPERGSWATHKYNAKYRGNWSPWIPRNVIIYHAHMIAYEKGLLDKYKDEVIESCKNKRGQEKLLCYQRIILEKIFFPIIRKLKVLDPFIGSGTTCIEAKVLGVKKCVGVDINPYAALLAADRVDFTCNKSTSSNKLLSPYAGNTSIEIFVGDSRELSKIVNDKDFDIVLAHPPYWGIIRYGGKINGDLSGVRTPREFIEGIREVANEIKKVVKHNATVAVLIGDTRKRRHYINLAADVIEAFVEEGFKLKEVVVKLQYNMFETMRVWRFPKGFLAIAKEFLPIFIAP